MNWKEHHMEFCVGPFDVTDCKFYTLNTSILMGICDCSNLELSWMEEEEWTNSANTLQLNESPT
jgi:hypothetical protein